MNIQNINLLQSIKNFYHRVITFITTGKLDYKLVSLKECIDNDLDTDTVLDFQEING